MGTILRIQGVTPSSYTLKTKQLMRLNMADPAFLLVSKIFENSAKQAAGQTVIMTTKDIAINSKTGDEKRKTKNRN